MNAHPQKQRIISSHNNKVEKNKQKKTKRTAPIKQPIPRKKSRRFRLRERGLNEKKEFFPEAGE